MTDGEEFYLRELAAKAEDARMVYEAHAMRNTPNDPAERRQAAADMAIAWRAWQEARDRLFRAQRESAGSLVRSIAPRGAKPLFPT